MRALLRSISTSAKTGASFSNPIIVVSDFAVVALYHSIHYGDRTAIAAYRAIEVSDPSVDVVVPSESVDERAIVVEWLDSEVGYATIDGARIAIIEGEHSIDAD